MKRHLKIIVAAGASGCICVFLFAYQPNCLLQLGSMALALLSLALVVASLVRIPFLWSEYRVRAFIPFLTVVLFVCLVTASSILGMHTRLSVFRRRLPDYQAVVAQMEAGQIAVPEDYPSPIDLPAKYNHLSRIVLAQRDPNGIVTAEFVIGGGFPVKHSGFLYRGDGHPERWTHRDRWYGYWPVAKNWYRVTD